MILRGAFATESARKKAGLFDERVAGHLVAPIRARRYGSAGVKKTEQLYQHKQPSSLRKNTFAGNDISYSAGPR